MSRFFSKSNPNLIAPMITKSVKHIIKQKSPSKLIGGNISDYLFIVYAKYIKNNMLVLIFLTSLSFFLSYRYYYKEELKNAEQFRDNEKEIIEDILKNQTAHLKYDTQPTFNPLYSVNQQQPYVNYLPSPIPINLPNKGIVQAKSLYPYPKQFQNLNNPYYDYNNVYNTPSRSYYHGTYNPYQNAQDTDIVNPLGFSNAFNTTTGNFVGGMVDANTDNILNYQTMIDNQHGNLVDSLKFGPDYLNPGALDLTMEPPYAL